MKIEGLVFVITGGSSGLGEACVKYFSEKGAFISIFAQNEETGNKLVEQIGEDKCMFNSVNVTDEKSINQGCENTIKKFGKINVLINCAGIGVSEELIGHKLETFQKVLQINLVGVFLATKTVAKYIRLSEPDENGERGVVVNVSSIAGIEGNIGQVAYSASKGGIIGMTMPMARDLGRYGIRVCTIAPGPHQTNIKMSPTNEKMKEFMIVKRFGRPKEFAHLAGAIVENPYMTGDIIRLDGGLRKPNL